MGIIKQLINKIAPTITDKGFLASILVTLVTILLSGNPRYLVFTVLFGAIWIFVKIYEHFKKRRSLQEMQKTVVNSVSTPDNLKEFRTRDAKASNIRRINPHRRR